MDTPEPVGDFTPAARVIADSMSPFGNRLTTIEVTLHRFVLAEFNTHRQFSRNSSSSRAIPASRVMRLIATRPALPLVWSGAQKGMTGGPPINPVDAARAEQIWLAARDDAVNAAERLLELGVHKSIVNRLLEPWMTQTVIVSATEWDNFFNQRCHPDAQPELRAAAEAMREALLKSEPTPLPQGRWHLPYIRDEDISAYDHHKLVQVAAARCARVSYLTHDGRRDPQADFDLYQRLVTADPPHQSPLEHVATPARWGAENLGNFQGWRQLRHTPIQMVI